MFSKWYEINGIKVQGKLELTLAEKLNSVNQEWKRGKAIPTPHGKYTPDFDCGDYYIEVKSTNSWFRALGQAALLENAKTEAFGKKDNTSQLKMEWTQANIKPVYVWVSAEDITKDKYFTTIQEAENTLPKFVGSVDGFYQWLKETL